jgi:hypothetical protein
MKIRKTGGMCPRCSAHALVWVCKLLSGNKVTALTWACRHCESVFDSRDLRSARAADHREKFSRLEKNSSWAY